MSGYKEYQLIEKLNQHNYANWRFKVEMLLVKEELFDVISIDPPNPINPEWTKRDNKARALINLMISDDHIIYVKNFSTARDTWNALKQIHERTNLSSKLYLLRKLYSIKLDENGSMHTHITKILETVDKLRAIGEEIKQSHISALLLCSLPPSYETLITALEARPETELTPDFISNKLKDEYNRRHESNHHSENNTKAFHAIKRYNNHSVNYNSSRANYKNYNQRKEKYCTYCRMSNHETSECGHLKRKTNNNKKERNYNYKNNNSSSLCFETSSNLANKRIKDVETTTNNFSNLALLTNRSQKNTWIIDSGSSAHITNDRSLFTHITNNNETAVVIANGNELKSLCQGDIKLNTKMYGGKIENVTLKDVLLVPDLQTNLLSVKKAAQNGCKVIFEGDACNFIYNGEMFMKGKLQDNLYTIKPEEVKNYDHANLAQECRNKNCINLWHRRTGHRHHESIKEIISKDLATGIKIDSCKHNTNCETCIISKLTDTPYPQKAENRSTKILQLIHSDILGPMQVPSIGQKSYILTFIDDYSRYTTIFLLNKKSEVLSKLKEFIAYTTNKFGKKPKAIRSDNGGEYISREMQDFLKEHGIHQQLTTPRCPSQNGVAERKNRSLIEMCRSMLSEAHLDRKFWGEAIHTANYLQNRLPTKANTKSPFELWYGKKPNLSHLRVFGCKAYTYVHKSQRGKLDNKAIQGIFTGYDEHSKAYRIYVDGKNIVLSRTVKFIEDPIANINENKENEINTKEKSTENLMEQNEPKTDIIAIELDTPLDDTETQNHEKQQPRRSERSNKGVPPDRLIYIAKNINKDEPRNFDEVMDIKNKHEKQKWIDAMNDEMESLKENKTWILVDPPQTKKIIGCRWTYKKKYDSDGNVQKYKARLVAKGFSQKYGEDFFETFAPVVSYATIRAFLTAAVYKGLSIQHVDIKTAFLHGDLEEDVYMTQPEGFTVTGQENKVCKLRKAIYGLKQAARSWHLKIGSSLNKMGFTQSKHDPCLYMKNDKENTIHIIVYVDDILISGNENQIEETIKHLNNEYELKNLGHVTYYLGINIHKTHNGNILVNQKNKINEVIEKFNLKDSKPCNTPMNPGYLSIDNDENILPNNTKYRQAIGALLYIANISRPDIAASVNILSRRNDKPRQCDWEAVKRVIRYLKTTKDLNLIINAKEKPILKCYADADYAGDRNDRKSTSGNLFMLGTTPIQWVSRKQSSVALSSAEAEYISAASASQEILWLVNVLKDLDLKQEFPIILYEDNQSTIKMIDAPKYISKTKHIDVRYHCIRDLKEKGIINIKYCPSAEMTADIMTKPLPKPSFVKHRLNMQLQLEEVSDLKGDC